MSKPNLQMNIGLILRRISFEELPYHLKTTNFCKTEIRGRFSTKWNFLSELFKIIVSII